jgi:hypothetical protein
MSMRAERRLDDRMAFRDGYLPPAARIRPGRDIVIVDLSCGGALVEGPWRFRPASRCDMHMQIGVDDVQVRARVVRCFVARLDRLVPVRYRTALAFDLRVELPERWGALDGYQLPCEAPEGALPGVAATRPLCSTTPYSPESSEDWPIPRSE